MLLLGHQLPTQLKRSAQKKRTIGVRFLATDQDILVADLLISLHKLFPVGVPVGQRIEDATLDHAGQALPSRQSSTESLNIVKLAAG